jgi:hypothetical protein
MSFSRQFYAPLLHKLLSLRHFLPWF